MMYFGPELAVEYDREWFEPDGDEIVVMQQHCGGGNLVAFKGFLNHNGNKGDLSFVVKRTTCSFLC